MATPLSVALSAVSSVVPSVSVQERLGLSANTCIIATATALLPQARRMSRDRGSCCRLLPVDVRP